MEYKAFQSKKHNLFGICKYYALFFEPFTAVLIKRKPDESHQALALSLSV